MAEPRSELKTGPEPKLLSSVLFTLKNNIKYDHIISHFEKFFKLFCLHNTYVIWKIYRKGGWWGGEATEKNWGGGATKMYREFRGMGRRRG